MNKIYVLTMWVLITAIACNNEASQDINNDINRYSTNEKLLLSSGDSLILNGFSYKAPYVTITKLKGGVEVAIADGGQTSYIGLVGSNDSAYIFDVLKKVTSRDYEFKNGKNGILRHYRKHDGKWLLAWIQFWDKGDWVWSQKPFDEESGGYFESMWLNMNRDSFDVVIPFDTGEIWHSFLYRRGHVVGDIVTYFRNGMVREVINHRSGVFKEYYPNGQLKIDIKSEGFLSRHQMINGIAKFYEKNGNLTERIEAQDFWYIESSNSFRVFDGSVLMYDELGILKERILIDTLCTEVQRRCE